MRTPGGIGRVITNQFKNIMKTHVYKKMTLWIKGGKEDGIIKIGATIGAHHYSWQVKLHDDKWRKVELPIVRAFSRGGDKKSFNAIKRLMFSTNGTNVTFSMADFKLIPEARELPLTKMKSLEIPVVANKTFAIDGINNEAVWQKALLLDSFCKTRTGKPAAEKTEARIIADEKTLYLHVKMFDKDTKRMRAVLKKRDQEIWQDDCFEILLDATMDGKSYKHIIVNSLGTVQDYIKRYDQVKEMYLRNYKWNIDFEQKITIEKDYWTLEMAIPLNKLGIEPGKPFGLQLGRENHGIKEYSALSLTSRFTEILNFPVAVIGKVDYQLKNITLGYNFPREMILTGRLSSPGAYDLSIVICNDDVNSKKQVVNDTITTDGNGEFVVRYQLNTPSESNYKLILGGQRDGKLICPAGFQFYLSLPPEIEFGEIFLNPKPKELVWNDNFFKLTKNTPVTIAKGASKRTWKTARYLRKTVFYDLFGLMPSVNDTQENMPSVILLLKEQISEFPKLARSVGDQLQKLKPQGYILDITPDNIVIIGNDEAGLYYGVVTLRQIIRGQCVKRHQPTVPCASIVDWPDLQNRMLCLWKRVYMRSKERYYDKERFARYIEECIAGNKLNVLAYLFDNGLEFSREAGMTDLRGFKSLDDYQDIARICKDHFIEFVPAFQSGGHSGHLTKVYPQLQEPGYNKNQVNVLHKDWTQIQFNCYQDILDALPETKYFFIWHDEWWHNPTAEIKTEFMGKPRWKIFADEVSKIHGFFKKRGIRVMMCSDMIARDHNGGYPYDIYKAAELIPKDIILMNWGVSSAPDAAQTFTKMGFEVWDLFNQFKTAPPKDVNVIKGFGGIQYSAFHQTFWWSRDKILPDYTHAVFRSADYAWNIRRDSLLTIGEWRRRYLNNIMSLYCFPKRRTVKWSSVSPVNFSAKANCKLKEWFGVSAKGSFISGRQNVAFIPIELAVLFCSTILS